MAIKKKDVKPVRHILSNVEPLTAKESVDLYLEAERRRLDRLIKDVVEECEWDPLFQSRLCEALPKRGRGKPVNKREQRSVVLGVMSALEKEPKDSVIETIALTLDLSHTRAEDLYNEYRCTWLDSRRSR